MNFAKYCVLLSVAALVFPGVAMARAGNEHTVTISDSVMVGGAHLTPGNYKMGWSQQGPQIQVTFLRHGKIVATAPATLRTNDKQVTEDDVVTRKTASNVRVLEKIDLSHQKEAIVFSRHGA